MSITAGGRRPIALSMGPGLRRDDRFFWRLSRRVPGLNKQERKREPCGSLDMIHFCGTAAKKRIRSLAA